MQAGQAAWRQERLAFQCPCPHPADLHAPLLQVFQLADKYEAPSLMEACRYAAGRFGLIELSYTP